MRGERDGRKKEEKREEKIGRMPVFQFRYLHPGLQVSSVKSGKGRKRRGKEGGRVAVYCLLLTPLSTARRCCPGRKRKGG